MAEALRAGQVDLITLHSGGTASNLVAGAYAKNPRIWTRNEFVILGPGTDPAGIRGMHDGAAALARIANTRAPFVDYLNSGPRELTDALWKKAGVQPRGNWLLTSGSSSSEEALEFARSHQAYLVLGRVPTIPAGCEILVSGDPEMQRSFVVMEANPRKSPDANVRGAKALSDFLLTAKVQRELIAFATRTPTGMPVFHPVNSR